MLVSPAEAQQLPLPVADALQRAEIPLSAVGAYVHQAGSDAMLVAVNETVPFNPASTMKLVTSDAALEVLGPTFAWHTQAFADGTQNGDVLHGDLIIKGSGDPKLVLENFWLFLRRIRAQGIREIRGNLVLDRSIFEETAYDPAQFDGDPLKPYNVGPDALLLNYKALTFRFVPDATNTAVGMTVDPPLAAYPVYPPRLANGDCGDWRGKLVASINGRSARFNGVYSAACGEKIWHVHPYQMSHSEYFHLAFRRIWADLGGTLKGELRSGTVAPTARLVAEWQSAPLAEIIRDINKYSNNVMARQLLLTMANNVMNLPANTERGAAVVRTWLANKGIEAPELSIENGSGLSRSERISVQTMGRLLDAAFRSPTMPEFMASLPLVGQDGTMRQRLVTQAVAGKAHIKTGLINEVRAIAGYVLAASGKRYVVVCMINHANAIRGQEAQDALLQWIYENG
ncbi:MAG TPA: D-alanyl-D-alanine carboxypeptidase/D-alanyl-D-alanine-endopeptidase [Noviherbaspirillum sp.]|nr:D-alanyl-D-alanine carboxypeptidase/D-alanyl-D-alanine-endopeptidase [Noviherbaspirillum sp.]